MAPLAASIGWTQAGMEQQFCFIATWTYKVTDFELSYQCCNVLSIWLAFCCYRLPLLCKIDFSLHSCLLFKYKRVAFSFSLPKVLEKR